MSINIEVITCRGKPSLWHRLKEFFSGSKKIYVQIKPKEETKGDK